MTDGSASLENVKVKSQDRPSDRAERLRKASADSLDPNRRTMLGQYFTPLPAAQLIASMLKPRGANKIRLLDPGAGVGSLTAAAVEHLVHQGICEIDIVSWEVDEALHGPLRATLEHCVAWAAKNGVSVRWELRTSDYLGATAAALGGEQDGEPERFNAIIMNPPYRKVNAGTSERLALEKMGVSINNLYTGFLALAAAQLDTGGALAAIIPRSFANGPYAASFRRFFFDRIGIEQLHLFDSRAHVFADADVLQENVIVGALAGEWPATVRLSSSHGLGDSPRIREVPAEEILRPDDPQLFLRIPANEQDAEVAARMVRLPSSLEDLELAVSTGKVVEFRARKHLRSQWEPGAVPLIRPNHLKDSKIRWPAPNGGKPNAITVSPESEKLLLPSGAYVLVKRLTAKEESRRVRAAVCHPSVVSGSQIAFENHLNVFHRANQGLPPDLAYGLAAYLNSSFVDRYVRQFNGHTQVNATDLRHLRYPSQRSLVELGALVRQEKPETQEELDEAVEQFLLDAPGELLPKAA